MRSYFQEANPNYIRPSFNQSDSSDRAWIIFGSDDRATNPSNQVKSNGKNPAEMNEDDLIFCSPTVSEFSYDNKLWDESNFIFVYHRKITLS